MLEQGLGLLEVLQGKKRVAAQPIIAASDHSDQILRSQAALYQSCLSYLATEDIPYIPFLMEYDRLVEGKLKHDFPWIGYATANLFVHAKKADRFELKTWAKISSFCSKQYLYGYTYTTPWINTLINVLLNIKLPCI